MQPQAFRLRFEAPEAQELPLFHALVCEAQLQRLLPGSESVSFDWCSAMLASTKEEVERGGLGMWLLYEIGSGEVVGFAGWLRLEAAAATPQMLFVIRGANTRLDYAHEAAVAMVDFAREHKFQGAINSTVEALDVAATRVLMRLGFECIGSRAGAYGLLTQYELARRKAPVERRTHRLVLRPFRESDSEWFARLNADPRVMRHFPGTLTRAESDTLLQRLCRSWHLEGIGPWVIQLAHDETCVGVAGLARPRFECHFTPCVEVLWRLDAERWGNGYALEAASAALYTAFVHLELAQVVSFTVANNQPSWRVMQRLGMQRDPTEDFEHPKLPQGHPLGHHVLYRMDARAFWGKSTSPTPHEP
jgi:RimJ/RimL family protein N-acetyltransferase